MLEMATPKPQPYKRDRYCAPETAQQAPGVPRRTSRIPLRPMYPCPACARSQGVSHRQSLIGNPYNVVAMHEPRCLSHDQVPDGQQALAAYQLQSDGHPHKAQSEEYLQAQAQLELAVVSLIDIARRLEFSSRPHRRHLMDQSIGLR